LSTARHNKQKERKVSQECKYIGSGLKEPIVAPSSVTILVFQSVRNQLSLLINIMALEHHQRLRMYKAAVALNGTAVSLLERHCYHGAMHTFKDALDLIRVAIDEELCPGEISVQSAEAQISECLRMASRRLMKSFEVKCISTAQDEKPPTVSVLSDNPNPTSNMARELFTSTNIFAFRIDDDNQFKEDSRSMDLEIAIILHNFATAYLWHVRTIPNGTIEMYQGPYNMFHRALVVLSRKPIVGDREVDDLEALRILAVSTLVVKGLVEISSRMSMTEEATNYYKTLCILQGAVHQLERFPRILMLLPERHAAVA
jgi:hypothetical protein